MSEYLLANYHAHTTRCGHAVGTEREYIEAAIRMGIKKFGFSDHAPIPYEDFVSGIRMKMDQAKDYVTELQMLREEYKDQIEIKIGFEMEYLPEYFEKQIQYYNELGIDYLILGQHFNNEKTGPFNSTATTDNNLLTQYVETIITAVETGKFAYVAHPDIFNWCGDEMFYESQMKTLCRELKRLDCPLEINVAGMAYNKHYPSERFFKIAGEIKNKVIIGLDAHSPQEICDVDSVNRCKELARKCNICLMS